MEPTKELIDAIYRDRVRAARRTSPEERLLGGGELFDSVQERMLAGLRAQFRDADERTVRDLMIRHLNRIRRIEERGIYRAVEDMDDQQ